MSWGLLQSCLSSPPQLLPPLLVSPCSFQKRTTKLACVAAKLPFSHDKHSSPKCTARDAGILRGRERTTEETGEIQRQRSGDWGPRWISSPASSYHSPLSSLKHAPMLSMHSCNVQSNDKPGKQGQTGCTRTHTQKHAHNHYYISVCRYMLFSFCKPLLSPLLLPSIPLLFHPHFLPFSFYLL